MNYSFIVFYFLVVIPSAVVHEVAHGVAAYTLGDDTAKRAGRLTLNPIPHIDMIGTIMLPLLLAFVGSPFLFAYAKPVPYNPYALRSEFDELKVALAGPISNFLLAALFAVIARFLVTIPSFVNFSVFLVFIVMANIVLGLFNLIPIPPLDGSKLLYLVIPKENIALRAFLERYGMFFLLFFLIFGLDMIEPLYNSLSRIFLGPVLYQKFIEFIVNF